MKSFVSAMKEYFGFLPGQTLKEFGAELKALSDDERDYFYNGLKAVGVECSPPAKA